MSIAGGIREFARATGVFREKLMSLLVVIGILSLTFAVADLTKTWPAASGSADLVVGNLVLEHIADLGFIFAEAARCLQPGDQLFFSELHPFRQYHVLRINAYRLR